MAKIICLVMCIMAVSLSTVSAFSDAEKAAFREAMAPIITECSLEHGVDQEEIEAAKKAHSAEGIKPCFIGCVMKKTELIDSNGQYTPEKGMEKFKKFVANENDLAKFEEVAKKCLKVNDQTVTDGDAGCERATLVMACAIENKAELPV